MATSPAEPMSRPKVLRYGERWRNDEERWRSCRRASTVSRLQALGWTPAELAERRRRSDPIARGCDRVGVVVHGVLPPSV